MLEMNLSVEVGSAADVVWKIVGNFNGMPAWHPLVRASVLEPSEGGVGAADDRRRPRRPPGAHRTARVLRCLSAGVRLHDHCWARAFHGLRRAVPRGARRNRTMYARVSWAVQARSWAVGIRGE